MDPREIRLRCIEAAARNPVPNSNGYAAGVHDAAKAWFEWIISDEKGPSAPSGKTLGLPKKG